MAKLFFEIANIKLEAEGEEEFLREIYHDFKKEMMNANPDLNAKTPTNTSPALHAEDEQEAPAPKPKKNAPKKSPRKSASPQPKIDQDLTADGLKEFFSKKNANTNPEYLLVFAIFLRDELGIDPCTEDQLYTCYWMMKSEIKIPKAFRQAITDTKNKKQWLDRLEDGSIKVTNVGENAFHHELEAGD